MAGLFFCLASAEGAGLLFCPNAIQPNTSVFIVFCAVNAVYTASAAKQCTGLYRGFFWDLSHSTAANTRPTQAAIIPPAPRWSVCQRPDGLRRYKNHRHARALYRSAQPLYYNKVYKGAPMSWIHARQCSISQTMPARRGQLLPCVDRWQVPHPAYLLRGQRLHLYRVNPAARNH